MALQLDNFSGFETDGLEEAKGTAGSPVVNSTAPVRTESFSLKLDGAATAARYDFDAHESGAGAGNDLIVGFAFRTNDLGPTADVAFFSAFDEENSTNVLQLRLKQNGDLVLIDNADAEVGTATTPFTVDTWHYIEVHWQELDSGAAAVFVDGVSEISVTAKDFRQTNVFASSSGEYRFLGGTTVGEDIAIDDFYCYSGGSGTGDFLGEGTEVLGTYQNTVEDATDQGDALEAGTWAITGDTTGVDDATAAAYTSTLKDGHTICDEGARPGPGTAGEGTGTIKGGKWLHRLERGNGGGTTHSRRHGHNGDTVLTATSLSSALQNFFFVEDVSVAQVPTSSEDFAQGFKVDGAQDIECAEMWAFLLHIPSAGPDPIPDRLVQVEQAINRSGTY